MEDKIVFAIGFELFTAEDGAGEVHDEGGGDR